MIKTSILRGFAIILLFVSTPWAFSAKISAQDKAKGYVFEDLNNNGKKDRKEKGIPGVAVSNGRDIVVTDADGKYEINVNRHCIIFAIKPKGYISPVNHQQQPQNYYIHKPDGSPAALKYKGSEPTGELPSLLNFPMKAYEDPENFRFFAFGDPQPYSVKEVEYFRRAIVEETKTYKGISFGISLGDVVGNHLNLHPLYLDAIKDMEIPWYHVIGNHDRNYDAGEEKFANETFESNFGPSTYAFRYGNAHFIILDDIFMHLAPKSNPYKGGFSEEQFEFLENYMKLVKKGELVILSYHIPIAYKDGQFIDSHRRKLFKILSGHNVFGLSAHTHIQMQFFYGNDLGWDGEEPFHEYNVGTSNGDWYSGKLDERGLPDTTMRDGTPQGYAIVNIKNDKYTFDYKSEGMPIEHQMTVYSPKIIPCKQGGKYPLYTNFYIGTPNDKVEFRIDKKEWKKMNRVTNEADPTYLSILNEWDKAEHAIKGRRPNSVPTTCTHLWKAVLDNTLEPGEHNIEIRATDMFGRIHTAKHSYKIEIIPENEKD